MRHKLPAYDKQKSRRSFDRAAQQYDQYAHLQQRVASTLVRHFDDQCSGLAAKSILDLGCGTGQLTESMCERYPQAEIYALDFSRQMLLQTDKRLSQAGFRAEGICADAEQLPFQDDVFDLVVSSLMLQWSDDLTTTLAAIHELLSPNGVLAFSSFSEGTLQEVKASWQAVDDETHSSDFMSLDVFKTAIEAAGYSTVQIIPETTVMRYKTVRDMLIEIKGIGASNASMQRARGLTGKQRFAQFEAAFDQFRSQDGEFPCTWEITYIFCAK